MIDDRFAESCRVCGAAGYGNATCRDCVSQWPRFGMPREIVDQLLEALCGVLEQEPFIYQKWHGCDQTLLLKLQSLVAEAR
jgi:hypothetical protein